jgi:hypothetical protein
MLKRIQTILIVSAITAIVWAFAEAESLRPLSAEIDLVLASEPSSIRTLELLEPRPDPRLGPGTTLRVVAEIEGPAATLAQVERVLRDPIRLSAGDPGMPKDPGTWPIVLRDLLRDHPALRGRGMVIRRIEPATITLRIDDLVERQMPIRVDLPEGETDGPAESRPRTATVLMPKAVSDQLGPEATVAARVDQATWDRLVPGRRETIPGVRLEIPNLPADAGSVRIRPAVVDISLAVRTRTSTIRVATVPVHVRMPPVEMALFDVEIPEQDRVLIDVVVSGPADLVRQIEDKTLPLIATVTLTYDDLERAVVSKEATFSSFPTPLKFEVANRTVRLKITRREKAPG